MNCKKCGKLLNEGEIICTNCGTPNELTNNIGVNNNSNLNNQFGINTNNQSNIPSGGNVNSNQTINNGVDAFAAFNQNFDSTTMNNANNASSINNSNNLNAQNTQNVIQPNISNGIDNIGFNNPVTQPNADNNFTNSTSSNNNMMGNVNNYSNQNINSSNGYTNFNNQNLGTVNNDRFNNQNFNSGSNKPSFINKIINFVTNNKKRVVFSIVGFVIAIIVIVSSVLLYTSLTSKEMICKSSYGNFTLRYKGSKITGYTSSGTFGEQIDFDINEQNNNVKEMGIDEYLRTFSWAFIYATDGTCTIDGKNVTTDTENDSNVLDGETWDSYNESKTIGNDEYGYVKVPNDWVEFHDVNGNNMVQYSYAGVYIVSLYAYDGSQYSAKDYATAYATEMKKDESAFLVDMKSYTENLNDMYDAYIVSMSFPDDNSELYTYWFEAEDGKVHYIAIEGPEKLEEKSFYEFVEIADTFTLTK